MTKKGLCFKWQKDNNDNNSKTHTQIQIKAPLPTPIPSPPKIKIVTVLNRKVLGKKTRYLAPDHKDLLQTASRYLTDCSKSKTVNVLEERKRSVPAQDR